ncbi:class II glutamine amidotransferase [Kitasatospora sp. NPDC101176]|uniref:class II glutamine amidotransferase n=1 Tax=Kitasatospora sp. NPDC101176 TaxID=3364099 RepID=UPI003810CBC3
MCRLILASGTFDPADIVAAAVQMSRGLTADHDNATTVHAHGWGAVWRDPGSGALRAHRDERPAAESAPDSPVATARTDFLAIHVRNATLPENRGPAFTHPLERPGDPWYFMHNGYLPTAYRGLGLAASAFDSAEYFDYLIPPGTDRLDERTALARLRALEPGGTSGNAVAVHPDRAHLVHWSPPDTRTPRFFAMRRTTTATAQIVASETVPALAPSAAWRPVAPGTVLTFPFTAPTTERTPTCPSSGAASSTTSTSPASPLRTVPASSRA